MDYQEIINQYADCLQYVLPLAITIGLIERVISWMIRCATGKES